MGRYEEAWKIAWTILFLIFLLVLVFATAQANHVVIYSSKESNLSELMLVAATLVITGIAVMLAILALWGYRELKDAAILAATKEAAKIAESEATKRADELVPRLIEARLQSVFGADSDGFAASFPRSDKS
jgi:predicted membrane protein